MNDEEQEYNNNNGTQEEQQQSCTIKDEKSLYEKINGENNLEEFSEQELNNFEINKTHDTMSVSSIEEYVKNSFKKDDNDNDNDNDEKIVFENFLNNEYVFKNLINPLIIKEDVDDNYVNYNDYKNTKKKKQKQHNIYDLKLKNLNLFTSSLPPIIHVPPSSPPKNFLKKKIHTPRLSISSCSSSSSLSLISSFSSSSYSSSSSSSSASYISCSSSKCSNCKKNKKLSF